MDAPSELFSQAPAATTMEAWPCRPLCGACCIAPSITSAIPGMPQGKPAGVRCIHLDESMRCGLFGRPERPAVCASLRPNPEMCGANRDEALRFLEGLEDRTKPVPLMKD